MRRSVVYTVDVVGPLAFAGVGVALAWGEWAVVGFAVALGVLMAVFQVLEDRRAFRSEDCWTAWDDALTEKSVYRDGGQ